MPTNPLLAVAVVVHLPLKTRGQVVGAQMGEGQMGEGQGVAAHCQRILMVVLKDCSSCLDLNMQEASLRRATLLEFVKALFLALLSCKETIAWTGGYK